MHIPLNLFSPESSPSPCLKVYKRSVRNQPKTLSPSVTSLPTLSLGTHRNFKKIPSEIPYHNLSHFQKNLHPNLWSQASCATSTSSHTLIANVPNPPWRHTKWSSSTCHSSLPVKPRLPKPSYPGSHHHQSSHRCRPITSNPLIQPHIWLKPPTFVVSIHPIAKAPRTNSGSD